LKKPKNIFIGNEGAKLTGLSNKIYRYFSLTRVNPSYRTNLLVESSEIFFKFRMTAAADFLLKKRISHYFDYKYTKKLV